MNIYIASFIHVLIFFRVEVQSQECPKVCTCDTATLSNLPINSVLVRAQHGQSTEHNFPSYQNRNEVLDEADEHKSEHKLGEDKLKAATCILQATEHLPLFHYLPSDLQVLTILQGPDMGNITLDEFHFQHLQNLVVLEIHGFPHGRGHLRLRNNALKHLYLLQYLNLQYIHLLGDNIFGNRPAPLSDTQSIERNIIPGAVRITTHDNEVSNDVIPEPIQLDPLPSEADILPYNVYREQQERAGLSTFSGLHSLVFLRAFHCNIKEVSWEMFEGLQQLEYLSLEGNKIPFLHEFSFYGTPNLKHLILSHNKLLDVQSTGLAGLLKLEILDLSYNNISHLTEFSLPPFPELFIADFHHNPLELILPYTFQVLNNTKQLFLGGKKTQLEIRHNSFVGLNKLHKMSLNSVYLEVLEMEYLKGMANLKQLKIEGTIHELAFDAFASVPKLQELILKHCSIRKISMDAFFGLYGLIYLDLSHNELETLPPSLFDHQKSLKEINLNNNKLTTLPGGIFIHTSAKLIRLDKNPWHCTCSMNTWQPSQINKAKIRVIDNSMCQTQYDKGSMCKIRYTYQYVYEQSASPRCATPVRYSGWSVFHLLRKHLRCDKKMYKHKLSELKAKAHRKKVEVSVRKHTVSLKNGLQNNNAMTPEHKPNNTLTTNEHMTPSTDTSNSTDLLLNSGNRSETNQKEQTLPSNQTDETPSQNILNTPKNESEHINVTVDNQHMWTEKDHEKYRRLLMKDETVLKKSNLTANIKKNKPIQDHYRINVDAVSKTKKKADMVKKWESKMENTMRRLNKLP